MTMTISPILLIASSLITFGAYKIVSRLISSFLWNKFAVLKDVPLLSKERPKGEKFTGTAIICGGSIAGLFAARVCANHFEKVLIIEPEEWVAVGEQGLEDHHRDSRAPKRARVAQYTALHHFHYIMTLSMQAMFSTFEEALRSAGGRLTRCYDILWVSGIPKLSPTNFPLYDGGTYPLLMSITRPAFETTLRRLVLQTCTEVQYSHGTVTGLLYDENLSRVSGVSVKLKNGETVDVEGTLVVDATGSFMGGHRWLKDIPKFGNSRSPSLDDIKIAFDPKVSYTLSEFALPPALEEDFRRYRFPTDEDTISTLYGSLPLDSSNDRVIVLDKREKNFLHINCGGYGWNGKIRSVGDIEDFLMDMKLKRPLPQWIFDVLHTLQSEDVPVSFRDFKYPLSVYIKYHKMKNLPSNFVVVGDAQAQTDPVFGHGCSKACASAVILNYQLHQSTRDSVGYVPRNFAKRYFLDVKDRTEYIWENMKNIDYNFSTTVPLPGENTKTTARFFRAFSGTLLALTTKDSDISEAFLSHVTWLEPQTAIMAPWIVGRVAWAWIKQFFGYEIL